MSEAKMTAEERVAERARTITNADGDECIIVWPWAAIRIAKAHAAAAVENLEARIVELEAERDEARMRSTQLRCELAQALKCIAELEASIDEEAV